MESEEFSCIMFLDVSKPFDTGINNTTLFTKSNRPLNSNFWPCVLVIATSVYGYAIGHLQPRNTRLDALLEGESPAIRGQEQSNTFRRRSANIQKCILYFDKIPYNYWRLSGVLQLTLDSFYVLFNSLYAKSDLIKDMVITKAQVFVNRLLPEEYI
ncbi:hypothetical protein KUTeg_005338 [Tegillarca granosa]|uniref:Uncharacterized protein n=1 Tax=Tegillarca granosa TaxID=220873 RepID=A0ABQ9FJI9_TEGGR|nr:hypothetical protein KUTeg_005338 [Tegillarca granosa]